LYHLFSTFYLLNGDEDLQNVLPGIRTEPCKYKSHPIQAVTPDLPFLVRGKWIGRNGFGRKIESLYEEQTEHRCAPT